MLWKYDSNDWEINGGSATVEDVDANYQKLVDDLNGGAFNNEGAIILTHEIDNSTMSMAVKWYDKLNEAFDVSTFCSTWSIQNADFISAAHRPSWRFTQSDQTVSRQ